MAEAVLDAVTVSFRFIMEHLVIINILLSLVIIFFQRRSPLTVWTWLLILYFIPILGFVLYLVLGQDYHKSRMFRAGGRGIELCGPSAGRKDLYETSPAGEPGTSEI